MAWIKASPRNEIPDWEFEDPMTEFDTGDGDYRYYIAFVNGEYLGLWRASRDPQRETLPWEMWISEDY